jgi:hypothetical protein
VADPFITILDQVFNTLKALPHNHQPPLSKMVFNNNPVKKDNGYACLLKHFQMIQVFSFPGNGNEHAIYLVGKKQLRVSASLVKVSFDWHMSTE